MLAQQPCVLITLMKILGSAPRESGSRMIVTAEEVQGSIGGGNLEYTAIARARDLLLQAGPSSRQQVETFGLGPELNQCCGGAVRLLYEYLPAGKLAWLEELASAQRAAAPAVLASSVADGVPSHFVFTGDEDSPANCPAGIGRAARELLTGAGSPADLAGTAAVDESEDWWLERIADHRADLWLFGAGHVGQEVATRIRGLPFRLTWLDRRPGIFPADAAQFATLVAEDPVMAVEQAGPGSIFVVMTHSHQLDEDICHAILARQQTGWDFAWLGLIGSATKRKRFVHRLRQRGISDTLLERLVCPIGLAGIHGKQPATIALSLLAQLMMGPTEENT